MSLWGDASVQSPRAYDLANLQGAQLAARIAGAASATVRGNMRTALADAGYRFKITAAETAAGLTDASLTFGFDPGDVRRYGADPTGAADSTAAWQAALSANSYVFVPDGTYALTTGAITLPAGARIEHSSGATLNVSATTATYVYNASGDNWIRGGKFSSANDWPGVVHATGAISKVTLEDVYAAGPRLLWVNSSAPATGSPADMYPNVTDANSPDSIILRGCIAAAAGAAVSATACVLMQYARNWIVDGCILTGYANGVQFWGGDSDPNKNGVNTNARKCRAGTVSNCFVSGPSSGGIWGSMGEQIRIIGNHVELAGDVAIDFEGCWDSLATGNVAVDSTNGNFTTYFYSRGVRFIGNRSYLSGAHSIYHFRVNNSTGNGYLNLGVEFSDNDCDMAGGYVGNVGDAGGPAQGLTISGNRIRNGQIAVTSNNNAGARIRGNIFSFDTALTSALNVIDHLSIGNATYGNSVSEVCENVLQSAIAGTFPAGSNFIHVNSVDTNHADTYVIEGNRNLSDNGPATDLYLENSGTNAGVTPTFNVRGNVLLNATGYTRNEAGAGNSTVRMEGNTLRNGTPFPSAIPTTQRWDVGTRVWYSAPAAAGAPGAVCTTAGAPGTWSAMANLA